MGALPDEQEGLRDTFDHWTSVLADPDESLFFVDEKGCNCKVRAEQLSYLLICKTDERFFPTLQRGKCCDEKEYLNCKTDEKPQRSQCSYCHQVQDDRPAMLEDTEFK